MSCSGLNQNPGVVNLKVHEDYILEEKKIVVKVLEILDSRCPKGARCITEGFATIKIKMIEREEENVLTFRSDNDEDILTEKYKYRLIDLIPYPELNRQINEEDYIVVLSIKQR